MHKTRCLCAVVTAASIMFSAAAEGAQRYVEITNVHVQQQLLSPLVDVWYELQADEYAAVVVGLYLSTDSGATYPHLCVAVSGDVGPGVLPGTNKHVVWNAGQDLGGFSSSTCRLRVTADEGFFAPAGTFTMGSPVDEIGRWNDEVQHQVTLTHGFTLQATEVTNWQYCDVRQWAFDHGYCTVSNSRVLDNLDGSTEALLVLVPWCEISFNGGTFTVDAARESHPLLAVTWYGAAAFCDWLSLQQDLPRAYDHATWECNGGSPYSAIGYRLPTEAEWEYACRAGSATAFANGPSTQAYCSPVDQNLDLMGWYCGNAAGWTHPVGQKLANAWGLYDMHGNLFEWCNDWWYGCGSSDPQTDPVGPEEGDYRVLRGGAWGGYAFTCRSAYRYCYTPDNSTPNTGVRPVRSVD